MQEFSERIRELRRGKGYSLRQLAPMIGVGLRHVSAAQKAIMSELDWPVRYEARKL